MELLADLKIERPDALDIPAANVPTPAQRLIVTDDQTLEYAADLISEVKATWKRYDQKRRELKDGALKVCRDVDAFFKPALEYCESEEREAKSKVAAYLQAREQERLAIEDTLRAAATEAKKQAEDVARQAAAEGDLERAAEAAAIASAITAPVVASTVSKVAGMATAKKWKATVADLPAFLAECVRQPQLAGLVSVDTAGLAKMQAVMKGKLGIPGIKFEQEVVVRSGKVNLVGDDAPF